MTMIQEDENDHHVCVGKTRPLKFNALLIKDKYDFKKIIHDMICICDFKLLIKIIHMHMHIMFIVLTYDK